MSNSVHAMTAALTPDPSPTLRERGEVIVALLSRSVGEESGVKAGWEVELRRLLQSIISLAEADGASWSAIHFVLLQLRHRLPRLAVARVEFQS